jgi:hypothetical protein
MELGRQMTRRDPARANLAGFSVKPARHNPRPAIGESVRLIAEGHDRISPDRGLNSRKY